MKDLAETKTGALTTGTDRRGFEEKTEREDLIIPMVKLTQSLSPEVVDGKAKPGMLINSLTKAQLPEFIIPIFKFTTWIKWNPRNKDDDNFDPNLQPGAMIWRTTDPNDPRTEEAKFGPNGEKPIANKIINFMSYFPGEDMPLITTFSKTSFKAGRKLISLASFSAGPMFSKKYKLFSKKESGDAAPYYILEVEPAGKVTDEEFKMAEDYYNMFKRDEAKFQIHEELNPSDVGE